ncbi:MAG: patatin-like phospholipase family protein [Bacteroidota bacterium]
MKQKVPKTYGFVFSGGGARGLFAVQILKRLRDTDFDFSQVKAISGVSVGSIIGAMLAQGDLDKLIEMFENITNKDIYKGKISLKRILWQRITGKNYVLDIEPLHDLLWKYIDLEKAQKSKKVFEIGLVDMTTGQFRTFNQFAFNSNEQYIRAIMASCSQPVIWKPQYFETRFEVIKSGSDGGVVTVSPIKSVLNADPDHVIIINSSPVVTERVPQLKTMESVLMRTIDLAVGKGFQKDMETFVKYNEIGLSNKKAFKHYPATIYQTDLHDDSLDFDSVKLKSDRVRNANIIFAKTPLIK